MLHFRSAAKSRTAAFFLILALALVAPLAASADLPDALRARLSAPDDKIWVGPVSSEDRKVLDEFYAGRGDAPLWTGTPGANDKGRQLSGILSNAAEHGLVPAYYDADRIAELLDSEQEAALAELELRLSLSLIRFASDLDSGRLDPRRVDPEHYSYPQDVDRMQVLVESVEAQDMWVYLRAFQPQQNEYERLKGALAHYRSLAEGGGWEPIPDGETIKEGMSDPRVPALRARLMLLGDLDPSTLEQGIEAGSGDVSADKETSEPQSDGGTTAESSVSNPEHLYEGPIVAALTRFQHRHGLTEDGVVGPKTLAALNIPVEQKVEQILMNMERRRWMPDDRGERYIFVNLANFDAKLVDGLDTVFHTKVVVGDPYHRTPVFSDVMTYLEINPVWNVPDSIASKELLPKIQENPNYLAERNYTLLSSWDQNAPEVDPRYIDWNQITASSFPFRIRQEPGENNALGQIKFMFPNRFNIYLHDTPSQSHFSRAERAFSHGCIRVAKPIELAGVLLEGQEGWDQERVRKQIASRERLRVELDRPIPVHLSYITAWVNADGVVHFRDDIYNMDGAATVAQNSYQ